MLYPDEHADETETNITHGMVNRRSQQMTEHFWNRWQNEYLTSLKEFHKVDRRSWTVTMSKSGMLCSSMTNYLETNDPSRSLRIS